MVPGSDGGAIAGAAVGVTEAVFKLGDDVPDLGEFVTACTVSGKPLSCNGRDSGKGTTTGALLLDSPEGFDKSSVPSLKLSLRGGRLLQETE